MSAVLVSAIMPTKGRREWAQHALRSFLAQDYAAKELIILDDFAEPSFHESIRFFDAAVRYDRVVHATIATKRNQCAALARGDVIMHFDSDDWSAPTRMSDQLRRLDDANVALTGYHSLLFYDPALQRWGKYFGATNYALGTSLCYRRDWWAAHPFEPSLTIGEDNDFTFRAAAAKQLVSCDGGQFIVARVHANNTSRKNITDYAAVASDATPAGFFS